MSNEQTALPYGGFIDPNSGFSGSKTSEARARREDRSGLTGIRQRMVLLAVRSAGEWGMTWREAAVDLNLHHGQASGALTGLHKTDRIARLVATRNRCSIYVTPENVNGRETETVGVNSSTALLAEMAELLNRRPRCDHVGYVIDGCLSCETQDVLRRYEARLK